MPQSLTQVCFIQSPWPFDRPLLTCTSIGDSNTGLAQSLWGLWVLMRKTQNGGVEEHMLIFSWKKSKITTHCWTTINRRVLDLTKKKKKIPHVQGQKRSSSKMVGGAKLDVELNPIHTRGSSEGSNKILCAPVPRDVNFSRRSQKFFQSDYTSLQFHQ